MIESARRARDRPGSVLLLELRRWVLRGGLFMLPLAYTWNTYDQFVLPKLVLARVLAAVLVSLLLVQFALEGRLTIRRTPIDLPLGVWLGSSVLSTAFAVNTNVAIFGTYSRYDGLLTSVTYAALFWLAGQSLSGPADVRSVFRVMLASGYLVAGIAIGQSVHDSIRQQALAQAFGPLGQPNVLGTYLAMLLPLGAFELLEARTWFGRIIAANVVALMALALLLSVSRSAWIAAGAGALVLLAGATTSTARVRVLIGASLTVAIAFVLLVALQASPTWRHLDLRLAGAFSAQDWHDRLAIWHDAPRLVVERPLVGFGPDTLGLVYGQVRTLGGVELVDKAHSELLQIAVTQGLVGVAAYALLLVAFTRAFWRGRHGQGAIAAFAGWVAYETALQPNFTALASALPFWIFAAGAIAWWSADRSVVLVLPRPVAYTSAILSVALLPAVVVAGALTPLAADANLRFAADEDFDRQTALALRAAETAQAMESRESVYATEVGNLAFERGDWQRARQAYEDAVRLGTYQPFVLRNLAYVYLDLGLRGKAHQAALAAYRLNPYDPLSQSLLAQFDEPST